MNDNFWYLLRDVIAQRMCNPQNISELRARTAVNIRVGAISPLAGIAKFTFKLLLAAYLAKYLEHVPMACIGGILIYVAHGMVKTKEIKEVWGSSRFHIGLMVYTAVMVPVLGFMWAVVSAIAIYGLLTIMLGKSFSTDPSKKSAVKDVTLT